MFCHFESFYCFRLHLRKSYNKAGWSFTNVLHLVDNTFWNNFAKCNKLTSFGLLEIRQFYYITGRYCHRAVIFIVQCCQRKCQLNCTEWKSPTTGKLATLVMTNTNWNPNLDLSSSKRRTCKLPLLKKRILLNSHLSSSSNLQSW